MTFWRLLGLIALIPLTPVAVGILAFPAMLYYNGHVFPQRRPERALKALFLNPSQAQVIESEQHGAFMIGKNAHYLAQGTVAGLNLRLRPYMVLGDAESIRRVLGGWKTCDQILQDADSNLKFYGVSMENGPGDLDSYVVYQPSSHKFCFNHLDL